MALIKLSKDACMKAISYSDDAKSQLLSNVNMMDNNVNSQFEGLQDPAFNRYLSLSEEMQTKLKLIASKMEAISDYCRSVMMWIDEYSGS